MGPNAIDDLFRMLLEHSTPTIRAHSFTIAKAREEVIQLRTALKEIEPVAKLAKGFWKEVALNALVAWHEKWKELFNE